MIMSNLIFNEDSMDSVDSGFGEFVSSILNVGPTIWNTTTITTSVYLNLISA